MFFPEPEAPVKTSTFGGRREEEDLSCIALHRNTKTRSVNAVYTTYTVPVKPVRDLARPLRVYTLSTGGRPEVSQKAMRRESRSARILLYEDDGD